MRVLTASRLCASTGLGAYSTVLLVYLVRIEHLGSKQVGLALTGAGLAALAASPIIGRLADRGGAARPGPSRCWCRRSRPPRWLSHTPR